jgi:hypothetical protein
LCNWLFYFMIKAIMSDTVSPTIILERPARAAKPEPAFVDAEYLAAYERAKQIIGNLSPDRFDARFVEVGKGKEHQWLPVSVVRAATNPKEAQTLLHIVPWSDSARYSNTAGLAAVLSELTGYNVVTIGLPGMGKEATALTRRQRRALRKGNFEPVAEAQLEAFQKAYRWAFGEDLDKEKAVHLWGVSQGASNIVAMAEVAHKAGYKVGDFIMGANVALTRRKFATVALGFCIDGLRGGLDLIKNFGLEYMDQSNPVMKEKRNGVLRVLIGRALVAPRSHLLPVAALAKGLDADRIVDLVERGVISGEFIEWAGGRDLISTEPERAVLSRRIELTRLQRSIASLVIRQRTLPGAPHAIVSDPAATVQVASLRRAGL